MKRGLGTVTIVLYEKNRKGPLFNIALRVNYRNLVTYLNLVKVTKEQYDSIFIRRAKDEASIEFRTAIEAQKLKCESLIYKLEKLIDTNDGIISLSLLREMFFSPIDSAESRDISLMLFSELTEQYVNSNRLLALRSKRKYLNSSNSLEKFKPNIKVIELTHQLLIDFEQHHLRDGKKSATVASYMRDIKAILNYYVSEEYSGTSFIFPFGRGRNKYQIKTSHHRKDVLTDEELNKVLSFTDFESSKEEYAFKCWKFLYGSNGMNPIDLILLRKDNFKDDYFFFERHKTINTRKNNLELIPVFLSPDMQKLISFLRNKDDENPFFLGELKQGFNILIKEHEKTLINKVMNWGRYQNRFLARISNRLGLSQKITMASCRDLFTNKCLRSGVASSEISRMLGHSSQTVIENYIGKINLGEAKKIGEVLFK
jgi:integrase